MYVSANILAAYGIAALCVFAGIYGIVENKWYYSIVLWALALAALAYARSKGKTKIETPLFRYEGTLAEEVDPPRFEGEVQSPDEDEDR